LIFFRHFVELPAKNQRYWTTFETLAEMERDCKERQLSSAWRLCSSLHPSGKSRKTTNK